jgi:hypothetical protein
MKKQSMRLIWALQPVRVQPEGLQPAAVPAAELQPAGVLRLQAALRPGRGHSHRNQRATSPLRVLQARLVISFF